MNLMQRKHYRDGYIERADLDALGERVLTAFAVSPDSAKGKNLITTFENFWAAMVGHEDEDADGRIDPGEFHRGMSGAYVTGDGFERAFLPAIMAVIAIIDTDNDGVLSVDEFRTFQRAFGTPTDQIETAFLALDGDGTGTLMVDELASAARQFYIGQDENAQGNLLFGVI